jgi:hypothetical protein
VPRLVALAWLNIAVHVVALAFAAFGMRAGTPLVPLAARMAWLAGAPLAWTLGWAAWMLCALALVAFYAALAGGKARFGLLLVTAGAAVDLLCDATWIAVVPSLAKGAPALFLAAERAAGAGGTIVANGLYTLGGLCFTIELRARRGLFWVGVALTAAGLTMVAAGFSDSARLLALSTGPTIGLFCLWTLLAAHAR